MEYVVCHYHEIALKGGNRGFFEHKLVDNIKKFLPKEGFDFVKNISGRIIIKLNQNSVQEKEKIENALKNIFGIVNFSFVKSCEQDLKVIKKASVDLLKKQKFTTFRVSSKRSNKKFGLNSQQINEEIGAFIVQKMKKKVSLKNFNVNLFIEIVENYSFLYLDKIKGRGGLPVGVSGKGLVLISGGIDSPVAAFLAMKRGIKISFIHFHSFPFTDQESIEKVKDIIKILNKFQFRLKLYLCPFADIQREILLNVPAKFRVVLYKRMMLRIADEISKKEKIETLVTGENVGQVASQTLENIKVIQSASDKLILRPLICQDKIEIIEKAKNISTFDISIIPHQDCCTRFVPRHPATKARLESIEKAEQGLNIKKLVKKSIQETEIFDFKFIKNE